MSVTSFEVRKDLQIDKRQRRLKQMAGNGTHYSISKTLNSEVKEWLKEMTKSHWYLHQNRIGQLFIAFHDENEAMRYKLAWH